MIDGLREIKIESIVIFFEEDIDCWLCYHHRTIGKVVELGIMMHFNTKDNNKNYSLMTDNR
jgi:hypothetical protein